MILIKQITSKKIPKKAPHIRGTLLDLACNPYQIKLRTSPQVNFALLKKSLLLNVFEFGVEPLRLRLLINLTVIDIRPSRSMYAKWLTGLKSIFETGFKRHSEPRLPSTAQINH